MDRPNNVRITQADLSDEDMYMLIKVIIDRTLNRDYQGEVSDYIFQVNIRVENIKWEED